MSIDMSDGANFYITVYKFGFHDQNKGVKKINQIFFFSCPFHPRNMGWNGQLKITHHKEALKQWNLAIFHIYCS